MKLNEYHLLDAIGHADEKLIRDTAPQQWETASCRRPFLRRRTSELIAVCAAICIFVGAGFLIRNLYGAEKPLAPFGSDQADAKDALECFLAACKQGDREKMLETSLIETVSNIICDEPDEVSENIEDYLNGLSAVTDYEIGSWSDYTAELDRLRQTEHDLTELQAYLLKSKGKSEEAEKLFRESKVLDYCSRADMMFGFKVTLTGENGEIESSGDDNIMTVVRYDGKWYAEPVDYLVPSVSEEGQHLLEQFRNEDPHAWDEFALKTTDTDTESEEAATKVMKEFLKTCKKGNNEKIRSSSLLEQVCALSGSEDPAEIEEEVSYYADAFARIKHYIILGCFDTTSELNQAREVEDDYAELNSFLADYYESVGKTEKAEELKKPRKLQEFLRHADKQYSFLVQMTATQPDGETETETEALYAVRYDREWYALPISLNAALRMADSEKETLDKCRNGESFAGIIRERVKQQQDTEKDVPQGREQADAEAALQIFLQLCEKGDEDGIRSMLYADQVFKLENPGLTDEEREQKIRDYIREHYVGFPANAEIGTVEEFYDRNLYFKRTDIRAYVNYLAYQSGNALANHDTMLNPEKNAHLYLDMVEGAYSMFAYNKERNTADSHFILVYVQNRWCILPFVYQEHISEEILEAARQYEYNIYGH